MAEASTHSNFSLPHLLSWPAAREFCIESPLYFSEQRSSGSIEAELFDGANQLTGYFAQP